MKRRKKSVSRIYTFQGLGKVFSPKSSPSLKRQTKMFSSGGCFNDLKNLRVRPFSIWNTIFASVLFVITVYTSPTFLTLCHIPAKTFGLYAYMTNRRSLMNYDWCGTIICCWMDVQSFAKSARESKNNLNALICSSENLFETLLCEIFQKPLDLVLVHKSRD